MSDKCIIVGGKVRSLEKGGGRVPEGKLREMYAYLLMNNVDPTDIFTDGIRYRYSLLKKLEAEGAAEGHHDPTVVPIKLTVGDEGIENGSLMHEKVAVPGL
jgi:hypothetical protein